MAVNQQRYDSKQIRSIRELFKGRFTENDIRVVFEDNGRNPHNTVTYLLETPPEQVRADIRMKFSTLDATASDTNDAAVNTDEQYPASSSISALNTPCPSISSSKNLSEADGALITGFEQRNKKILATQQQIIEKRHTANKEQDAFVEWVRSVIMELDHGLWRRCQQDISNTLYRYIAENDQLKKQQKSETSYRATQSQFHQPSIKTQCLSEIWQPNQNQCDNQTVPDISTCQSRNPNWVTQQVPQNNTQIPPYSMKPASTGPPSSSTM